MNESNAFIVWKKGNHYASRAALCDALANALEVSKSIDRDLDIATSVALYRDTGHSDDRDNTYAGTCYEQSDHNNGYYEVRAFSGNSVRRAPHFSSDKLLRRIAIFTLRHDDDVRRSMVAKTSTRELT